MRAALGIGLALLLTGCGSMSIEVSVLNPTTVEQEIDRRFLRETLPDVLGQSELAVEKSILDVQNKHFEFLIQLSDEYGAKARRRSTTAFERQILAEQARGVQTSMKRWKSIYEEARQQLLKSRTETLALNQTREQAGADEKKAIETRIAQTLRRRNHVLINLQELVQDEMRERLIGASEELGNVPKNLKDAAMQTVEASKRSLIAGQGLVEDPYAYTVASAEDHLWAHQFNTVIGRGTFGNLNMAVKMEDLGDFTLKGLTFDPSDVARVASKVTTQALLLASQISGVPVNLATSDTTSGGEGLRVSSKRLADAESTQTLEEAKIEAHEEGLMAVAATVLREWPSLESDAQRAAGIAAIKGSFAANKPRIKMEQASTTSPESDEADEDETDEAEEDDETGDEADEPPLGLGTADSPTL